MRYLLEYDIYYDEIFISTRVYQEFSKEFNAEDRQEFKKSLIKKIDKSSIKVWLSALVRVYLSIFTFQLKKV